MRNDDDPLFAIITEFRSAAVKQKVFFYCFVSQLFSNVFLYYSNFGLYFKTKLKEKKSINKIYFVEYVCCTKATKCKRKIIIFSN